MAGTNEEENAHLEGTYDIEKRFTTHEVRKVLMDGTDNKAGGQDGVNIPYPVRSHGKWS
jgi:hypothetical protein